MSKKAFFNKHKTQTESQFVSGHAAVKTAAVCEESVFQKLNELHEGFSSGLAVWNVPNKKASVGKEGAQIPQNFTQLLLPDKLRIKRWNFYSRMKAVEYLVDNKAQLYTIFKGSWSSALAWLQKRIAAEVVWSSVATQCNLKYDYQDGKPMNDVILDQMLEDCLWRAKPALEDNLPQSRFEIPYHDWEQAIAASTAVKADYVNTTLITYVLDKNGKMKITTGKGAQPLLSDLEAPTNVLYHKFVEAVKGYFFEPLVKPVTRKGAVPSVVVPGFEVGTHGFISYTRHFAGLSYHEVPLQAGSSNEEVQHYNRDLTSITTGNEVKVVLLPDDVFNLPSAWRECFETPSDIKKHADRLALGFADPPWGVNSDASKMGGIDMKEERWGR